MVVQMRKRSAPKVVVGQPQQPDDDTWAEKIDYRLLRTGAEGGRQYARPIDPDWVGELAKGWDPNKLDVLHVSYTEEDGAEQLTVICGNHRLEAARKRNTPFAFWCIVYTGLTIEEEARKFDAIDQERKRHTVRDGFRSRIVFNDQRAVDISRILDRHGLSVDLSTAKKPSRDLTKVRSVGALYDAYEYAGPELFDRAIGAIVSAWGTNVTDNRQATVSGQTIVPMTAFLWRYEDLPQFDVRKLVRALQVREQEAYTLKEYTSDLQRLRLKHQREFGTAGNTTIRFGMEVLVTAYNRRRAMEYRLPSSWVRLSKNLVRAEKAAYLAAGLKGDTSDSDL